MTLASAHATRSTRELRAALITAELDGAITKFWSRPWDRDDIRTVVIIPDPTDEVMLARVREICLAAFPDIIRYYEIRPEENLHPNDKRGRKLAFGFHRPHA